MEKLTLDQKIICSKIGKTFELIAQTQHWYEINFINVWLNSCILERLLDLDETFMCQSKIYIKNDIVNEFSDSLQVHPEYIMNSKSLSWLGYILMYWMYGENIFPLEIADEYDLVEILIQYDS